MTYADHVHTHLLQRGPCTVQEVYDAMRAAGRTTARTTASTKDALRYGRHTYELPDGRWQSQLGAVVGATFTTRPRSRVRDGVLWTHRDLEPLEPLFSTPLPLEAGGAVRCGGDPGLRTLIGPAGWLPEIGPGDLLAVRWDGTHLSVTPVVEPPDPARSTYVRNLLAAHVTHDATSVRSYRSPVTSALTATVLSALREDPDLFAAPVAPLSELLPLPDAEAVDPTYWEHHGRGERLLLRLPHRVLEELHRRADLLGDTVTDYASMLLGAAVDRARPLEHPRYSYRSYDEPSYDSSFDAASYDEPADNRSVVTPFRART